jgi:hypothetical protein
MFLLNLLNVLVRVANKMRLQKKYGCVTMKHAWACINSKHYCAQGLLAARVSQDGRNGDTEWSHFMEQDS